MVEGICYVCNQPFSGADRETVINQIVAHMLATHLGHVKRDTLEAKNKFEKCPVCGAPIGKPLLNCPNCGANLIEHFGRKITMRYVRG
jgi:ribosomal protein S27AE